MTTATASKSSRTTKATEAGKATTATKSPKDAGATGDPESMVWVGNIEKATITNETFRTVLFTGPNSQVTVMALSPGEDIGWEMHDGIDQFLRVEQGTGQLEVGEEEDRADETHEVGSDDGIVVPAGTWHNLTNTGRSVLKLYSVYSPPEHDDGTVHRTKEEAEADGG
ncbi:MAG: cupin domain-containing protein [Acidimicrobiales bacterium]